jgi:hypothetical protein
MMGKWVRTKRSFFRPEEEPPFCALLGGSVPVLIHTGEDEILPGQLEALARFLAIPADRRPDLYGPLFADYREVRSAIGEGPRIGGPEEVWSFVRWNTVLVPRQGPTGHRFVFVEGDPAWEIEHGVELFFRDEQLVHVGRAEGDFCGRFWEWLGRKQAEPAAAAAPAELVHSAAKGSARRWPMTEAEWLACSDPVGLAQWELISATNRKVRLFAVACCRRIPVLNSHAALAAVIDTIERFADRLATEEELREANLRSDGIADRAGETADEYESAEGITGKTVREWQIQCAGRAGYWASLSDAESWTGIDHVLSLAADAVALAAVNDYDYDQVTKGAGEERAAQADLFRDVFGNPFCPVTVDPRWLTPDVVGLARGIYEDGAFERMPVLADALMDAGCADETILAHCRSAGPHVRGCWVVDLVLGKV